MENSIETLKNFPLSTIMATIEQRHASQAETLYHNHAGLTVNTALRCLALAEVLVKYENFKYFRVQTMMLEESTSVLQSIVPVTQNKFFELSQALSKDDVGRLVGAAMQFPSELDFDFDIATDVHSDDPAVAVPALIALLGYLMPFERNEFSRFINMREKSILSTTITAGDYVKATFQGLSKDSLDEFLGSEHGPVLFAVDDKYYGTQYFVETQIQFEAKPVIEGEVEALEILVPNLMTNAELEEAEMAYNQRLALIQALPFNQEIDLAKLATLPDSVIARLGDPSTHPRAFENLRPVKVRQSSAHSKQCRELVEATIHSLDTDVGMYSESFMEVAVATVQRLLTSMRNLKPAEDTHDHTTYFNVVEFMGPDFVKQTGPELPVEVVKSCVDGDTIFVPFDRAYLLDYLKAVGMTHNTKRVKEGAVILALYTTLRAHLEQYQLSMQAGEVDEDEDEEDDSSDFSDSPSDSELIAGSQIALHNLSLTVQVAQQDYDIPTTIGHGIEMPLNRVVSSAPDIITDASNAIKYLVGQLKSCESDGRIDKLVELGYDRDTLEALDHEISENYLNRLLAQHNRSKHSKN